MRSERVVSERVLEAAVVFARLEELRELLRLTDYLSGFRRDAAAPPLERAMHDGVDVVVLYRPTGSAEMELLAKNGMRRWPPRLPEQPIFYPVTNEQYAREIAERWNLAEEPVAYVTRFRVRVDAVAHYAVQTVGARHHAELWVPAEELDRLNDGIVGPIEVVARLDRGQR